MELKYKFKKSKQQMKTIPKQKWNKKEISVIFQSVKRLFQWNTIIRLGLLYINYRLVEAELYRETIRIVPIEIGETQYNLPILVLLLFPILLNMGLTEIILKKMNKGEPNVHVQR